jgi:hypothetical protein
MTTPPFVDSRQIGAAVVTAISEETVTVECLLPEIVEKEATVVFTHALFPPWGRIAATKDGYTWVPVGNRR